MSILSGGAGGGEGGGAGSEIAENKPFFTLFPNQIGWAVDITKISREFTSASLSSSTEVHSITEVYSDRFVYPDSALVFHHRADNLLSK